MTKPLTAETFIAWMWAYEYQFDSKADHSAFRNRFSRQIARLNEDAYRSDQPRPLTPDAITDEMVERARAAYQDAPVSQSLNDDIRDMLTAALTEPPARPEGAEDIERLLTEDLGDFSPPVTPEAIADLLAVRGVRVTGGN